MRYELLKTCRNHSPRYLAQLCDVTYSTVVLTSTDNRMAAHISLENGSVGTFQPGSSLGLGQSSMTELQAWEVLQ